MTNQSELAYRIVTLERLFGLNDATIQSVFHLSPACSDLLGLLLAVDTVPLNLHDKRLVHPRTTVMRLRKQLRPWGLSVRTCRGVGYYLDSDTKRKIREKLDQQRQLELPL